MEVGKLTRLIRAFLESGDAKVTQDSTVGTQILWVSAEGKDFKVVISPDHRRK